MVSDAPSLQEIQQQLALEPGQGLRVLDPGPWIVMLERVGGASPAASPEQPPSLVARLESYGMAELFRWVEGNGKTGMLTFCAREQAKCVYLHRGEVVFATSNQQVDRLGESLLRAGIIDLEQLREAQRCFRPGDRFGKILVERGFLTPRELWNGVKHQVEEIVRSLFSYAEGRICFWEGDFPPDNVVRLSLPTRRLIEEGLQRRQELASFLAVLGDARVRLAHVAEVDAELSPSEKAIAAAIPEEGSFPALCERLAMDPESAARSVQLLRLVGAVKLVRASEEPAPASDAADPVPEELRELVDGLAKLTAQLAAAVAVADGDDGIRERLGEILEDAASRFPVLLGGLHLGAGGTLDPEALLERALRLGEEAETQLVAGLGELVAYLEFEVMNHPGIADSDAVLSGLAELRANLA